MSPQRGALPWYRSEEAALVVSGVGKLAAAAGVAYLHARTGEAEPAAWIDAGIAGHPERELGEVLLAHTVRELSSNRTWHPTRLGGPELARVEVVTVDAPESRFEVDAAYDMEASGFYPTALRFSSTELVQVVKVVSDNRSSSWTGLRREDVGRLVGSGLDAIEAVAVHLRELVLELARATASPPELDAYRERFRLSVSQQRKLERLLERWRSLAPDAERGPEAVTGTDVSGANEILARVEREVARAARERPL
jgi:hypothetical protein